MSVKFYDGGDVVLELSNPGPIYGIGFTAQLIDRRHVKIIWGNNEPVIGTFPLDVTAWVRYVPGQTNTKILLSTLAGNPVFTSPAHQDNYNFIAYDPDVLSITLYQYSGPDNVRDKPLYNPYLDEDIIGVYYNTPIEKTSPVIRFTWYRTYAPDFNYVKVDGRYYYVRSIQRLNTFDYVMTLAIDVLQTYKTAIAKAYGVASRIHEFNTASPTYPVQPAFRTIHSSQVSSQLLFSNEASGYKVALTINPKGGVDEGTASTVATRSGMNATYMIRYSDLGSLAKVFNDNFWSGIGDLIFGDKSEYVYALKVYPFNVADIQSGDERTASPEDITIAGRTVQLDAPATGNLKGYLMGTPGRHLVAEFNLGGESADIRNYSRANVQLFLPFYGYIDIDPRLIYGGVLRVYYTIDWSTGHAIITIERNVPKNKAHAVNGTEDRDGYETAILRMLETSIAVNVPYSGTSYNAAIGNTVSFITTTAAAIAAAASGGSAAPLLSVVPSATNLALHSAPDNIRGVMADTLSNFYMPLECYILVSQQETTNQRVDGTYTESIYPSRPYNGVVKIGETKGFLQMESVYLPYLDGTMTHEERREIERILKTGTFADISDIT